MQRFIYIVVLCAFSFPLVAQNIDSLLFILQTKEISSEEEMEFYSEISRAYIYKDIEKSREYAEKGLKKARKTKDVKRILNFYHLIGTAYNARGVYDTALIYYNKSLLLIDETGDRVNEAAIYISTGTVYMQMNENGKALEYFTKALSIVEKSDMKNMQITLLNNIGSIHRRMNNDNRALIYFEQMKTLAEEVNDNNGKCGAYFNLGNIYYDKNEVELAVGYIMKTLDISRVMRNKQYETVSLMSLAKIYYTHEKINLNMAEKYAKEALHVAEEYGDTWFTISCWGVLSDVYCRQGKYDLCKEAAKTAWEMDTTNIVAGRDIIGNIVYANIFLDDKNGAVNYLAKYQEIVKDVNEKSLHDSMMEMEVKYEAGKKEMRINALEKLKKTYNWLAVAVGLIVILLTMFLINTRRLLNTQKELAEHEKKLTEQQINKIESDAQRAIEKSLLEGEVQENIRFGKELHDNVASLLTILKENLNNVNLPKARKIVDDIIKEVRGIIRKQISEVLFRYGLKAAVEDFCLVIDKVLFQYIGENKRFDRNQEIVMYRGLQELINNALKYADADTINVQIIQEADQISLVVYDDGKGFDPKTVKKGFGLSSIEKRIAAQKGIFKIESYPGKGTDAYIELKLKQIEEKEND